MRISGLLGAVIAVSVLAPIAPIPAHANNIAITLGIGTPHFTAGTFNLADPDWSFANDPNWATEIVPCALLPWLLGEYVSWETTYHPQALPIIDPVVAASPPIDPIGLLGGASVDPIGTPGGDPPRAASAVPEPSTWAMLLIGFTGLGYAGWRRSKGPIAAFD
jgi:PEP-CTERM motif